MNIATQLSELTSSTSLTRTQVQHPHFVRLLIIFMKKITPEFRLAKSVANKFENELQ
jgi:hypothetical protein